jgi:hypothetical protein
LLTDTLLGPKHWPQAVRHITGLKHTGCVAQPFIEDVLLLDAQDTMQIAAMKKWVFDVQPVASNSGGQLAVHWIIDCGPPSIPYGNNLCTPGKLGGKKMKEPHQ